MKKTILTIAAGLLLFAAPVFAEEEETKTVVFNDIADTWVRENNETWNSGTTENKIEIQRLVGKVKKDSLENIVKTDYIYFAGLIAFKYKVPEGYKVEKAELKLISERYKGNNVTLRAYSNNFPEKTCWKWEKEYIADALNNGFITEFTPAGQKGKAITDDIKDENQNLDAWTNLLDITKYVKSLPDTTTRINLLLTQEGDRKGDQVCFFSKDNNGTDGNAKTEPMKNLSAESLKPVLTVTFVKISTDAQTFVAEPFADTYVRSDNEKANASFGTEDSMEIQKNDSRQFYGLMSFKNLPEELNSEEYELQKATLRLVCTQNKGDRWINIYPYNSSIEESTTYNKEFDNINKCLAVDSIATFSANGQGNMAMWDYTKLSEEFRSTDKWVNYIDLKDYISSLEDKTQFGILISKRNQHGQSMKLATKEAKDMVFAGNDTIDSFTFLAEDIKPVLTLVYVRKADLIDPALSFSESEYYMHAADEDGITIPAAHSSNEYTGEIEYTLINNADNQVVADIEIKNASTESAVDNITIPQIVNPGTYTLKAVAKDEAYSSEAATTTLHVSAVILPEIDFNLGEGSTNPDSTDGQLIWNVQNTNGGKVILAKPSENAGNNYQIYYAKSTFTTTWNDAVVPGDTDYQPVPANGEVELESGKNGVIFFYAEEADAAAQAGKKVKAEPRRSAVGKVVYAIETGVKEIEAAEENAFEGETEYYTIQGIRVAYPTSGLYIVKQGSKTYKIMVR